MGAVPGELSTEAGPPLRVPLAHFVAATALPLLGVPVAVLAALGGGHGALLAHVHLLLAGWVCVTIMGAMTQFVPVWSGVPLHSRRLAAIQLPMAVAGVLGMAGAFLLARPTWLPAAGALLLAGLWVFVANVGRTLLAARPADATEAHFAFALACFAVVPVLGVLLAADLAWPSLDATVLPGHRVLAAHATLAVFGAVLATVIGALYQLATMFTGTDLSRIDRALQRVELVAYPAGVVGLAGGRLLARPALGRLGAALALLGLAAVAVVLAHRLLTSTVAWGPMHRRYAVAVVALAAWLALAAPAWLADPLSPAATLGPDPGAHLLLMGVVGFVVLGTLYHVVPFLVWVHRYSDRLGLEPVPLVDDLYDARIAGIDLAAVVGGTALLVLSAWLPGTPRPLVLAAAGLLLLVGFGLFAANVALVVVGHAPGALRPSSERDGADGDGVSDGAHGGPVPTDPDGNPVPDDAEEVTADG